MIDQALIAAIRQVAQIPTERRLWSLQTIAEYAQLHENTVRFLVARTDFPRPVRPMGNDGHPRWIALAITLNSRKRTR